MNINDVTEESMLRYVLEERDIELAAEGKRWYDLVRFGKSKGYKYQTAFIDLIVANNASASSQWLRSVLKIRMLGICRFLRVILSGIHF